MGSDGRSKPRTTKGAGGPKRKATKVIRPKGTRVVAPVVEVTGKGQATAADRRDAMMLYVMDLEKRPASWVHRTYFPALFAATVHTWSVRDKWADKRAEFWRRVDEALFRDFQQRIVRARMKELEGLETFASTLHGQFASKDMVKVKVGEAEVDLPIIPKHFVSRTDALRLVMAIDERIDAKRDAILQDLPAVGATAASPTVSPVHLSQEEAVAMAHARINVLQGRGASSGEVDDQGPVDEEGEGEDA